MRQSHAGILLLLAALLCGPLTGSARAQTDPSGEPVIASGDVVLYAHDDETEPLDHGPRGLCVRLTVAGTTAATGCGTPGTGPFHALISHGSEGGRTFVAGFVPLAGTATVEVELLGGARIPATTSAGQRYRGAHAGKVAFFLAETTSAASGAAAEPWLVRRFDAAGALSGAAAEPGYVQMIPAHRQGPTVELTRRGRRRDRPTVFAAKRFAPSPLRLDRVERVICLEFVWLGDDPAQCAAVDDPATPPMTLELKPGCRGALGTLAAGLTNPDVAHVELVLGSGRTLRRATRSLDRLNTAYRAYTARIPRREALRTVRAVDGSGATIKAADVGLPPAPRPCDRSQQEGQPVITYGGPPSSSGYGPFRPAAPAGAQVAAGGAPGARLLVRDEGEHLCVGVERLAADRRDCRVPHPEHPHLMYPYAPFATDERTAVGGVAPPRAATIRVEFDGEEVVDATISDGGAYTGRYRGHVRFFLAEAPGRRQITRITARDAQNRPIYDPYLDRTPGGPHRIATGETYRIFAERFDVRWRDAHEPEHLYRSEGRCLGVASPREGARLHNCGGAAVVARALCAPTPRAVVAGLVRRRLHGIQLQLGDGRVIASRTARVPRAAGGGRLWVIDVPARAAIRRVRVLGPGPGRWRRYPVPPATRQCGYALPDIPGVQRP